EPEMTLLQQLEIVNRETMEAYENQDYPFDLLVERLELDRDLSQSPLFNVMLAHNNSDTNDLEIGIDGVGAGGYAHSSEFNMSKFDLTFFMNKSGGRIFVNIEYNSDLLQRRTAQRIGRNYLNLVGFLLENPQTPISRLEYIDNEEKKKILHTFNDTQQPFLHLTIKELFEQQVEKTPGHTAVVYDSEKITYETLNRQANQLAHYLREEYRVKPNDVIGIFVDRSIAMIAVILGIIKAGAAYLSVDPNYPEERIGHILQDSRCKLVVAEKDNRELPDAYEGDKVELGSDWDMFAAGNAANPETLNSLSDIVYVIYTSGSTGTPNGALLSHHNLSNLVLWQREQTAIDSSLRCLQFTSINFCVSFQEIITTLSSGGELYLIGDVERQDIDYLMNFLSRNKIEILYLPFSYLNFLFNETGHWGETFTHCLKHIITAGEQLKITSGLKTFLKQNPTLKLHNHYGSSEMHVVTSYTLDASTASKTLLPPAGTPISNTRIYILDEQNRIVPIGVWGELCIAGSVEIAGYINNDELTREKLLRHPQICSDGKRLYRSGDIGRWKEDGNIELKGRKDSQIKIRGFRIEPGEIESKITMLEKVKDCVVVAGESTEGKFLLAYVVADDMTAPAIKRLISTFLPQHMIPALEMLDALPLMPNGKVDRARLPEPQINEGDEYLPPKDETESKLVEIWADVLGIEPGKISINAGCFSLGGDSLKATVRGGTIHTEVNVKIPLMDIFKSPTIEYLSQYIKEAMENKFASVEPHEKKDYYPLSPAQKRLYIMQQMETENISYNMPYIFPIEKGIDKTRLEETVKTLILRHESLRTSFQVQEEPVQKVHGAGDVKFRVEYHQVEAGVERESGQDTAVSAYLNRFVRPFDLTRAPLLRISLIDLGDIEEFDMLL
ncbi:MAG: amino acid adenylation domain-containing protein, partial [bacterium]|nr:amino acid adenylation domain-containing protein [bacterium]